MIDALKNNIDSKNPALPIYRRLAEELRIQIVSGKIAAGSRLPSEAELSEQLGINNRTLRKSLKIIASLLKLHIWVRCHLLAPLPSFFFSPPFRRLKTWKQKRVRTKYKIQQRIPCRQLKENTFHSKKIGKGKTISSPCQRMMRGYDYFPPAITLIKRDFGKPIHFRISA